MNGVGEHNNSSTKNENDIIDQGIFKQSNKKYWYKIDISQSLLSWYEGENDETAISFILIHQITFIESLILNDKFKTKVYLNDSQNIGDIGDDSNDGNEDSDEIINFYFKSIEERDRFVQSLQKCKSFTVEINSENVTNIQQKKSTTQQQNKPKSFIGTKRESKRFSQVKHPAERSVNNFLMGSNRSNLTNSNNEINNNNNNSNNNNNNSDKENSNNSDKDNNNNNNNNNSDKDNNNNNTNNKEQEKELLPIKLKDSLVLIKEKENDETDKEKLDKERDQLKRNIISQQDQEKVSVVVDQHEEEEEEEDNIESMSRIQEEINRQKEFDSSPKINSKHVRFEDESDGSNSNKNVQSLKVINYRESSEDDNTFVVKKSIGQFRNPNSPTLLGINNNNNGNYKANNNTTTTTTTTTTTSPTNNRRVFDSNNNSSNIQLNEFNLFNNGPNVRISNSKIQNQGLIIDPNNYFIIQNTTQLRNIIGKSLTGDTSFSGVIVGKFKIDWKPSQQVWSINLDYTLQQQQQTTINLNNSGNSIGGDSSSSDSSNGEIEIGPATPPKEELLKRLQRKKERAIEENDTILANLLEQRQIELERSQDETFIMKGGIVLGFRNEKWELLEAPIPKKLTPYHQDNKPLNYDSNINSPSSSSSSSSVNITTSTLNNSATGLISNITSSSIVQTAQSMTTSVFNEITKVIDNINQVVEPTLLSIESTLLNNNNNNNSSGNINNNSLNSNNINNKNQQQQQQQQSIKQQINNQIPVEDLNLSINQLQEIYIKPLKKSITDISNYFGHNNTQLEQYSLGDDSVNKKIAILVRGRLATAIANIISHGFIVNGSLFRGKRHLWEFVDNYRKTTSHNSIAGISLQNTINSINSFESLSPDWKDPNIKFRTFVCTGLNQHLLDQWFALLQTDTNGISYYYQPNAIINSRDYWRLFCQCFTPILNLPFKLSLDYECKFINSPSYINNNNNNNNNNSSNNNSPSLNNSNNNLNQHQNNNNNNNIASPMFLSTPKVETIKNSITNISNSIYDNTQNILSELSENTSHITESISNLTSSIFQQPPIIQTSTPKSRLSELNQQQQQQQKPLSPNLQQQQSNFKSPTLNNSNQNINSPKRVTFKDDINNSTTSPISNSSNSSSSIRDSSEENKSSLFQSIKPFSQKINEFFDGY